METTVRRKLSVVQLEKLMDASELVNIRFYTPVNGDDFDPSHPDKKINYKVKIRHTEDENPKNLLRNAVKTLEI